MKSLLALSSIVGLSVATNFKCLDDCRSQSASVLLQGVRTYLTAIGEYFPAGLAESGNVEARKALLTIPDELTIKSEFLFSSANAEVNMPTASRKESEGLANDGLVQCKPEEVHINYAKMWSALERAEGVLVDLAQCQRPTRCRALKQVFNQSQNDYFAFSQDFRNGLEACRNVVPLLAKGWNAIAETFTAGAAVVPGCPEAKVIRAGQIYAHAARQSSVFGHAEAQAAIQPGFCCNWQLSRGLISSTALDDTVKFLDYAQKLFPLINTKAMDLEEGAEKAAPIAADAQQCNCKNRLSLLSRQSCLSLDTVDSVLRDFYTASSKKQCDNLKLLLYVAPSDADAIKNNTYSTIRACIPCGGANP